MTNRKWNEILLIVKFFNDQSGTWLIANSAAVISVGYIQFASVCLYAELRLALRWRCFLCSVSPGFYSALNPKPAYRSWLTALSTPFCSRRKWAIRWLRLFHTLAQKRSQRVLATSTLNIGDDLVVSQTLEVLNWQICSKVIVNDCSILNEVFNPDIALIESKFCHCYNLTTQAATRYCAYIFVI